MNLGNAEPCAAWDVHASEFMKIFAYPAAEQSLSHPLHGVCMPVTS